MPPAAAKLDTGRLCYGPPTATFSGEVVPPFVLGLFVFTFLLIIPPIMTVAEDLIAKGVDTLTILRIMGTLLPQGLGVTIPMALLLGVPMGLGRLSSDRETVALQACGVSVLRMLCPLLLLGGGAAPGHLVRAAGGASRCKPGVSGDHVPDGGRPGRRRGQAARLLRGH